MPQISITNNSGNESALSEPWSETFITLYPDVVKTFEVDDLTLERMEPQLKQIADLRDADGAPTFIVDVTQSREDLASLEVGGVGSLTHYLANYVKTGLRFTDGTTATVFNAIRVDLAAGEAIVDGADYNLAAVSTDEPGDYELLLNGDDAAAVALTALSNVVMSLVLCRESLDPEAVEYDNIVIVMVRGAEVLNAEGTAVAPTTEQITTALSTGLWAVDDPYYGFVRLGDFAIVLNPTTTVESFTPTMHRPAPLGY